MSKIRKSSEKEKQKLSIGKYKLKGRRIQSRVLSVPTPQIYNAKITLKLYYAFYGIMWGKTDVCVIWMMM